MARNTNLNLYGIHEVMIRYSDRTLSADPREEHVFARVGPFRLFSYYGWPLPQVMDSGPLRIDPKTYVTNCGQCANVIILAGNAIRAVLQPGESFQLPDAAVDRANNWRIISVCWYATLQEEGWYHMVGAVVLNYTWYAGMHRIAITREPFKPNIVSNEMYKVIHAEGVDREDPVILQVWNPTQGTNGCDLSAHWSLPIDNGPECNVFASGDNRSFPQDVETALDPNIIGGFTKYAAPNHEISPAGGSTIASWHFWELESVDIFDDKFTVILEAKFRGPCIFNRDLITDVVNGNNMLEM